MPFMQQAVPFRINLKTWAERILPPALFTVADNIWTYTGGRVIGDRAVLSRHQRRFLEKFPKAVQSGPFAGMFYVDSSVGSYYLYKLIGSYEAVLHPYINALRNKSFDTIIDIGSAEGYYLAGFARMFPEAAVVGFELDEEGRALSKDLFEKNAITNSLSLLEEATSDTVGPLVTQKTLLICDCEGAEIDILDPVRRPEFRLIDTAIIELHDFVRPGTKEALYARFKDTHAITIVPFALPDPKAFPYLATMSDDREVHDLLVRERGWMQQEWMILERNHGS